MKPEPPPEGEESRLEAEEKEVRERLVHTIDELRQRGHEAKRSVETKSLVPLAVLAAIAAWGAGSAIGDMLRERARHARRRRLIRRVRRAFRHLLG